MAGGVVQVAEHLSSKRETLCSNPRAAEKKTTHTEEFSICSSLSNSFVMRKGNEKLD
jgi:hypothetical protein